MEEIKIKTRFKCGRALPITEFYAHLSMGDGHLNKCKDCTKHDMHMQHLRKSQDEKWIEAERRRGRDKYSRLYAGKKVMAHPETRGVRKHLKSQGIDLAGKEIHHWNYADLYNVFLLTPSEHKRVHLKIKFDKETKLFRYKGRLIETRDEHQRVIDEILSTPNYLF